MTYQHSMIQVLAVQDQVMVAILRNDCIVGLNHTNIRLEKFTVIDELYYTEEGAVKKIDSISLSLGMRHFRPLSITQKDLDAIDEAKIAHELSVWLEKFEKKQKTIEPQALIIGVHELQPLIMPLKVLVDILRVRTEVSLPEFDLVIMMKELIALADYLVRQNLSENGIELPEASIEFDEHICSAALAAEMGITYYEYMLTSFNVQFTKMVKERCRCLVEG